VVLLPPRVENLAGIPVRHPPLSRSSDTSSPPRGNLYSVGGAGDSPAPLGDSPSETGAAALDQRRAKLSSTPIAIPSGGSPDGTGESPVLPSLYRSANGGNRVSGSEGTENGAVLEYDAGEFFPGWRLGLSFRGSDPLVAASERQNRFYLWTGLLVVLIIASLALLVARYVAAQMRLARLKNDLVSTVSHELKTPLASMCALVDTLMARRYRTEEQLQDYLRLISKENQRLSHLIENFLTFSRLERGKQRFRFEDLQPESIVGDAVNALRDKLESPQCEFEAQVEAGLPPVRGDSDALTAVLVNLLENAHKYTETEKRIRLRTYPNGRHVCFEVKDNGIGLSRGEVRRIFDRFYQVDQSLTRKRSGCGLGLSIVQSIVRAHGGSVEVKSEPGHGSTFTVRLPARNGMGG